MSFRTWPKEDAYVTAQERRLLLRARQAIESRDLISCEAIVEEAEVAEVSVSDFIPALEELLKCTSYAAPRAIRKDERWNDLPFRVVAAHGHCRAIYALANALQLTEGNLRAAARDAIAPTGAAAVSSLLDNLRTRRDWTVGGMQETIEALGAAGDLTVASELLDVVSGDLPVHCNRWRKLQYGWSLGCGAAPIILVTTLGFILCIPELLRHPGATAGLFFGVLAYGSIMGCIVALLAALPVRFFVSYLKRQDRAKLSKTAADALIALGATHTINSLILIASGRHTFYAIQAARRALKGLLLTVNETHAGLLSLEVERRLTTLLEGCIGTLDYDQSTHSDADPDIDHNDARLLFAGLRAMEFIGSGQSARFVEGLVNRRPTSNDAGQYMQVRLEAERVLPILQERRRHEEAYTLLLRPSQASAMGGDVLLRPVTQHAELEGQLLRASTNADLE